MRHIKVVVVGALSTVLLLGAGCEESNKRNTTPSGTSSEQGTGGSGMNQGTTQGGSDTMDQGTGSGAQGTGGGGMDTRTDSGMGSTGKSSTGMGSSDTSGTGSTGTGAKPPKKGHSGSSHSTPDTQTH